METLPMPWDLAAAPTDPTGTETTVETPFVDTQVEAPDGTQVEVSGDTQVEVSKDTQVEVPKDTQVEVPKDTQMEVPKDSQVEVPKDSQVEVPKDSQVECPKKTETPEENSPESSKSPQFPMVQREHQQAFKSGRNGVEQMDAAAAKGGGKCKGGKGGKGGGKKRPAAAKTHPKAKASKIDKLASPVIPIHDDAEDVDDDIEISPKNLNQEFEEVADSPQVTKPKAKAKGKAKAKAKAKAQAVKTPTPKKTKSNSKVVKVGKLSPAAKKLAMKKSEKKDKGESPNIPKAVVDSSKKTFAGRRPPKTSAPAILRFDCLRESFQSKILPRVLSSTSYLEVGCSKHVLDYSKKILYA